MKHLKKFENFDFGRFNDEDEVKDPNFEEQDFTDSDSEEEEFANEVEDEDEVEESKADQVREYLEDNTSIVGEVPGGFVYAAF